MGGPEPAPGVPKIEDVVAVIRIVEAHHNVRTKLAAIDDFDPVRMPTPPAAGGGVGRGRGLVGVVAHNGFLRAMSRTAWRNKQAERHEKDRKRIAK